MYPGYILKTSRLEALFDGVFAIAMTILVLDLKLPADVNAANLFSTLTTDILHRLFIYVGSFVILGTLWIAMNFQLGLLERINRLYLWVNVFYLMVICVVPFSASLVGSYPLSSACIIFYAVNLLCASLAQLIIAECAHLCHLNSNVYSSAIRYAIIRRIFVAPIFYILSIFLAFTDTKIAFVALIAPTLIYIIPGRVDRFNNKNGD